MNHFTKHYGFRLFLMSTLAALVLALGVNAASTGLITGDIVNARKGPGTSYERVESLAKGKQVTILGEENGWYHIQWNDSKGYVLKDYISVGGSAQSSSSASSTSSSSASANATITGGSTINVRSGAGTSYSRIAMVGTGKRVAVLEKSGDWYKISFDGKTGYVMSDYVARDGSSASSSASANATVTGGSTVNVRSGPSTDASRVTMVAEGKRVAVLEKSGDWYKVSVDGQTGYIYSDFLKRDGSSTTSSSSSSGSQVGNATVKDNNVNVRASATSNSDRVTKVSSGKRITLTGKSGSWYQISVDGKTGFIYGDYVTADSGVLASLPTVTPPAVEEPAPVVEEQPAPAEEAPAAEPEIPAPAVESSSVESGGTENGGDSGRSGFITGGTINVRTGPGTDYERVTRVSTGKRINILSEENGWVKVSFGDTVGYVAKDYVYEGDELPASASGGVGAQVAAMAANYLGVPYVYGGSTPSGFDCSGLTSYLYKQFGYSLSRSASAQYANNGRRVSKSELQPGDLVYFSSPSSGGAVNHTAVYVGDGKIIHARYSMGKVYTNYLSESYYTKYYVGAIRVAD